MGQELLRDRALRIPKNQGLDKRLTLGATKNRRDQGRMRAVFKRQKIAGVVQHHRPGTTRRFCLRDQLKPGLLVHAGAAHLQGGKRVVAVAKHRKPGTIPVNHRLAIVQGGGMPNEVAPHLRRRVLQVGGVLTKFMLRHQHPPGGVLMAAAKHIGALEQGIYVFGLQILRERREFEHPGGIMLQAGPPRIGAGAISGANQMVGIEI